MFHASATVVVGLGCVLEAGLRDHIFVLQEKRGIAPVKHLCDLVRLLSKGV